MKLDTKGMTLIETIVSILVLSSASLLAASSFSAMIAKMSEGASIKNYSNEITAAINGDPDKIGDFDFMKQLNATAQLTVAGNTLSVTGTINQGTKQYGEGVSDVVSISSFTTEQIVMTKNEINAFQLTNIINSIGGGMGLSKNYLNTIKSDSTTYNEFILWSSNNGKFPYANNDLFRNILSNGYLKTYYGMETMPIFNTLNMKTKDGSVISDTTVRYIQPYFYDLANGKFIIYAGKIDHSVAAGNSKDWIAIFIFNEDDKHWYYNKKNSNFGLVGNIGSESEPEKIKVTTQRWEDLKKAIVDPNGGWVRIYQDE